VKPIRREPLKVSRVGEKSKNLFTRAGQPQFGLELMYFHRTSNVIA